MASQGSWGSNLGDFKVAAKVKRGAKNAQPKLAEVFDEFNNIVEAMAEEEYVENPGGDILGEDPEILGDHENQGPHDDSGIDRSPECLARRPDEDEQERPARGSLRMEEWVLDTLIEAVRNASNTGMEMNVGDIEMDESELGKNAMPEDIPKDIAENIQRHDVWYMAIVDKIFETAGKYDEETFQESPFSFHMLRWLQDNSDQNMRGSIYGFLLNPAVRSYRCRAAIGRRPNSSNRGLLFQELEFFPVTKLAKAVPNVNGTYLLHGVRSVDQDPSKDPIYVGQAAAVKLTSTGAIGIRSRGMNHYECISNCKTSKKPREIILHVHRRLSKPDIDRVEVAVLSMFPFPTVEMGEGVLRHYTSILTLVETIDVLLLGSLDTLAHCDVVRCIGSWEGLASLKPERLLHRSYEGLNRALPINQGCKRLAGVIVSTSWAPQELQLLINIVEDYEKEVYVHGRTHLNIDYDFMVSQLALRGVSKSKTEVVTGYQALAYDPDSGLITCRASRWKRIWGHIYGIKQHLEMKGLVTEPRGINDLFYHIPKLEDGHETSWHFRRFLKDSGYQGIEDPLLLTRFWATYLPRLLRKDVWVRITASPPDRLSARKESMPQRLFERTLAVVFHFARQFLVERNIVLTSNTRVPASFEWKTLTQIWHQASAQLLADGVPRDQILVGGAIGISNLLHQNVKRLVDSCHLEPLPDWQYDPLKNISTIVQASAPPNYVDYQTRDSVFGNGTDDDEGNSQVLYTWPSEKDRYEAVASSHQMLALAAMHQMRKPEDVLKVSAKQPAPCMMAQNSLSTLRVLTVIMIQSHQDVCGNAAESYPGDRKFWETLRYNLDKSWNVTGITQLEYRFSWVLELIRSGNLPEEARAASEILKGALNNSVLLSEKHPYNYEVECSTKHNDLLNPDLSSQWVKKFLALNGALEAVKGGIQARMGDYTIDGFCSAYGLLIPQVWEESMTQQGHTYPALEQIRPHSEMMASREDNEASKANYTQGLSPSATSAPQSQPAVSQPVDLPPSPPPYPPLQGRFTANKGWESNEDDYVRYLLPLPLSVDQKLQKFHHRFQSEHRSKSAFCNRMNKIRRDDQLTMRATPLSWDPEEHELLKRLLQTCEDWDELMVELEAKFPKNRSKNSIQTRAIKMELDVSRVSVNRPWTSEHDEYLKVLVDNKTPTTEYAKFMNEKFGIERSNEACMARRRRLRLGDPKSGWSQAEVTFIHNNLHLVESELCKRFWKQFGDGRSEGAISQRRWAIKDDIECPVVGGQGWTDEEVQFLKDWPHPTSGGVATAFNERFGEGSRSESAVVSMLGKMRLQLSREGL